MDGLDARRVHPDLEHRSRLGQAGHLGRVDLEGDGRPLAAIRAALEKVGAKSGVDGGAEGAQDAIIVDPRDLLQVSLQRLVQPLRFPLAACRRQ